MRISLDRQTETDDTRIRFELFQDGIMSMRGLINLRIEKKTNKVHHRFQAKKIMEIKQYQFSCLSMEKEKEELPENFSKLVSVNILFFLLL